MSLVHTDCPSCGLNQSSSDPQISRSRRKGLSKLQWTLVAIGALVFAPMSGASVDAVNFNLVSVKYQGQGVADYRFKVTYKNNGLSVFGANAKVVTSDSKLAIVDGVVDIGDVVSQQKATPRDTITLRTRHPLALAIAIRSCVDPRFAKKANKHCPLLWNVVSVSEMTGIEMFSNPNDDRLMRVILSDGSLYTVSGTKDPGGQPIEVQSAEILDAGGAKYLFGFEASELRLIVAPGGLQYEFEWENGQPVAITLTAPGYGATRAPLNLRSSDKALRRGTASGVESIHPGIDALALEYGAVCRGTLEVLTAICEINDMLLAAPATVAGLCGLVEGALIVANPALVSISPQIFSGCVGALVLAQRFCQFGGPQASATVCLAIVSIIEAAVDSLINYDVVAANVNHRGDSICSLVNTPSGQVAIPTLWELNAVGSRFQLLPIGISTYALAGSIRMTRGDGGFPGCSRDFSFPLTVTGPIAFDGTVFAGVIPNGGSDKLTVSGRRFGSLATGTMSYDLTDGDGSSLVFLEGTFTATR